MVLRIMPPLLLKLWREIHPKAQEQTVLFDPDRMPQKERSLSASLFPALVGD